MIRHRTSSHLAQTFTRRTHGWNDNVLIITDHGDHTKQSVTSWLEVTFSLQAADVHEASLWPATKEVSVSITIIIHTAGISRCFLVFSDSGETQLVTAEEEQAAWPWFKVTSAEIHAGPVPQEVIHHVPMNVSNSLHANINLNSRKNWWGHNNMKDVHHEPKALESRFSAAFQLSDDIMLINIWRISRRWWCRSFVVAVLRSKSVPPSPSLKAPWGETHPCKCCCCLLWKWVCM